MTTVSAVVVTYRSSMLLPALLPELTAAVDEVVIVDNASDDDSVAVARRLAPAAIVVERASNDGFAAGVNAGVAASTGELLLLVNPDVALDAAAVDALVAASRRHPGDVCGPVVRFPDGRPQATRNGLPTLWNLLGEQWLVPESARPGSWPARLWPRWRAYDREEPGPVLSGCSLLVPRATLARVGELDEGYFLYWEEIDWQVRAAAHGVRSWLVPSAQVVHDRGAWSGPVESWRVEVFYRAARRFVARQLPRRQQMAAVALLAAGQAQRILLWSLPVFRARPGARARRMQHLTALRALLRRPASGASGPMRRSGYPR